MAGLAAEAVALLARGDIAKAKVLVAAGCDGKDPEALAMRGMWRIEGKLLSRNLTAARRDIGASASMGNMGAARMHAGLLAAGVGGTRDWIAALETLDRWKDRDPMAARQAALISRMAIDGDGRPTRLPGGDTLSATPLIQIFPALLTPEECELLVSLAERRFQQAVIYHESKRSFVPDPVRDSDAAGFPILLETPFVHAINRRLASASGTTYAQGETLQLLRYRPGQQYRAHLDALPGLRNQRILRKPTV